MISIIETISAQIKIDYLLHYNICNGYAHACLDITHETNSINKVPTYVFYDTSIDSLVINDYNNMNVD